jgi:RNA polymerase sigma-70 factor, ECF subfamily
MANDQEFEDLWATQFRSVAWAAYLVVGGWEEAVEIAQEAFTRAYQHWGRISKYERPEAWVHRVATNLAVSEARKVKPSEVEAPGTSPAPEMPDQELMQALAALTPAQRAVISLRYFLDWSVADVAKALHKRPGTVTALTHQGMERLRSSLRMEAKDD